MLINWVNQGGGILVICVGYRWLNEWEIIKAKAGKVKMIIAGSRCVWIWDNQICIEKNKRLGISKGRGKSRCKCWNKACTALIKKVIIKAKLNLKTWVYF